MTQQIHDQNKLYDNILAERDAEKRARNRLSVEHDKTILDLSKSSGDQSLKDETSRLHKELNQRNIENAELRKELDRARTRYELHLYHNT